MARVLSRHLTALPGGSDQLPTGTLRPARGRTPVANLRPTPPAPTAPATPPFDWATAAKDDTVFVPLTPLEWSLIVEALAERGQGNSVRPGLQACTDLAAQVATMVRSRTLHPVAGPRSLR